MSNPQRITVMAVRVAAIATTAFVAACGGGGGYGGGGGGATYAVGVNVSGLTSPGLVLTDNGTDTLTINGDGSFPFPAGVMSGGAYNVAVKTQPSGETCTVGASASGTVSNATVLVNVTCTSTAPPGTVTIGGTVSGLTASGLVLQDNGGDDLTVASGAATFTFATAVTTGKPYAVTVKTQPTGETCSVASGSGTAGSTNVTNVAVTCAAGAPAHFVYVANKTDVTGGANGTISAFAADGTTGKLTAVSGSPFAVSNQPRALAVDSAGRLYVAGAAAPVGGQQIGVIATTSTGALTLPATYYDPNAHSATSAFSLLLNKDASFLVAVGANSTPANGAGAAATFTDTAGVLAQQVSLMSASVPNGELDIANGPPQQSALDPTGAFLLIPESGHTKLDFLTVNPSDTTDGTLNKFPANQTTSADHFWGATFSPKSTASGGFVYASLQNGSNGAVVGYSYTAASIAAYEADTTGATDPLTIIGGIVDAGCTSEGVAVDPSGKYLAVANNTGTPASGGSCAANNGGSVSWYTIDPTTGALTAGGADVVLQGLTATPGPNKLQWDPSGKFLYVANTEGSVSVLTLSGSPATLTFVQTVATGAGSDDIAIH